MQEGTTTKTLLEVSYTLNLPSGVRKQGSPASQTLHYPLVSSDVTKDHAAYYSNLSEALRKAKQETGIQLSTWKDAVGDLEKDKDKANKQKKAKDGSDEEDLEGDEEEA